MFLNFVIYILSNSKTCFDLEVNQVLLLVVNSVLKNVQEYLGMKIFTKSQLEENYFIPSS